MAVSPRRRGFTLVELLVVVVIIGMLVGLMMPALLNSRRTARQVTCINHLKEINKAAMLFHDSKKRLPGSIISGQAGNKPTWTWVIELLDPLGRTEIWETWRSAGGNGGEKPLVATLVCTEDSDAASVASNGGSQAALSYVPNNYYFRPRQYQNGLPTTTTKTVSMTDVKAPAVTILFSERLNNVGSPTNGPGPWAPFTGTDDSRVTFPGRSNAWQPTTTETTLDDMGAAAGISSNHPGVVIVAKADDSVEALSTRTDMSIYRRVHIP